jgi:hypothetical protein
MRRSEVLAGTWAVGVLVIIACIGRGAAPMAKGDYPPLVSAKTFQDLAYPASALSAKVQGAVVVQATLDDNGNIVDVFALSGSRLLVPDCLLNAKRWTFYPSPDHTGFIVYDFEIKDGECHDASRSLFQFQRPNLVLITACTAVK